MKWKVLLSAPYAMTMVDRYCRDLAAGDCEVVVADVRERLSEAELLPLVGDVDGIICGDDALTERVFAAAPRLKVVSKWGTGIDSIDQDAAKRHGVRVCNTPNAFSEPVADTVFGYLLLFARKLDLMNRDIRSGVWQKPQAVSLRELTLGVIGVGDCGTAVVRRAGAFGLKVLGHDIRPIPQAFLDETGLEMTTKADLLRRCDVVTLHTTLNPTSFHLMDAEAFAWMRPGTLLINTCRGPVVDEAALAVALRDGPLAAAGLDVFEVEPLPLDSPLRALDNCWFGTHNANSSPLAAERVHQNTIAMLLAVLQGHA